MIKLILLASLVSLPVIAQDIPETMPEETTEFVSEPAAEEPAEAVSEPEVTTTIDETTTPAEEPATVAEPESDPVSEENNTPVVTTEEAPEVAPVVIKEETEKSPVLSTTQGTLKRDKTFRPLESHWITTYGFEGLKYETDFNFSGEQKNFKPGDVELWGGRIGLGGEIYLGAGIVTTSKIEGYFNGTLFSRTLNAGPEDEDEEFSYSKETGQIYGFDLSQSIGYIFDMKTYNPMGEWSYLTVEPYIEVGVGRAWTYNRINYNYNTGATTNEGYKKRSEDELVNARFGGGINFTANSGFFFYIKAHVNSFDITKRETEEYIRQDGDPTGATTSTETTNDKIDPITTYALGGGYKF